MSLRSNEIGILTKTEQNYRAKMIRFSKDKKEFHDLVSITSMHYLQALESRI